MRYRVRHVTTYRYAETVDLASHLLHLLPRKLPHQRVLTARLCASPAPARRVERTDYFGNAAAWMFLDQPHDRFEVTLHAEVEAAFPAPPPLPARSPGSRSLRWRGAAGPRRAGRRNSSSTARWRRPSRVLAPTPPPVSRPAARCWRVCWT